MDNLTDIRQQILDTETAMESQGLCMRLYGSISHRIDGEYFYLAGGTAREHPLGIDDISRVRMKRLQGEAAVHASIYRARADVNAVILSRQCFASAMGLILPEGISAEDGTGNLLKIRTVPFSIPGSDAQRSHVRRLAAREGAASVLVSVGGGVFSYGQTLEEAFYAADALEDYAKLYLSEIGKLNLPFCVTEGFSSERITGGIHYFRDDTPQRIRMIHEKIYALRPDVHEIFHNRSEAALTVSRIGGELPAYYDDYVRLIGSCARIPGSEAGDARRGVVRVEKKVNVSLIYDDGAFCYGTRTIPSALTALSVEKACIAQIAAVRMGGAYTISRRDIRRIRRSM